MDKLLQRLIGETTEYPGLDEGQRKALYYDRHEEKTVVELATRMAEVQLLDDFLEHIGKYLHAELDVIRMNLLPLAIENEGLESPVNVAGVGRVSLTGDVFTSVLDKQNFYEWLHENNMGDLITESVNSSTLKAWAKKRIVDGKPMPSDELLKVTPYTRASITKAK